MTEDSRNNVQPSDASVPRKPYSQPELRIYGDIHEITQAVGKTGTPDNVKNKRTH